MSLMQEAGAIFLSLNWSSSSSFPIATPMTWSGPSILSSCRTFAQSASSSASLQVIWVPRRTLAPLLSAKSTTARHVSSLLSAGQLLSQALKSRMDATLASALGHSAGILPGQLRKVESSTASPFCWTATAPSMLKGLSHVKPTAPPFQRRTASRTAAAASRTAALASAKTTRGLLIHSRACAARLTRAPAIGLESSMGGAPSSMPEWGRKVNTL
mmetsp:Transcript_36038/g.107700  ORF Transcript_36038/g.107700 Transcript_36038/m.107700 type:complete len:215 (-) Transcript_36038:18-662(-)